MSEQMIIDLLQSENQDVRLTNLSTGRVLIWHQGQWMVKATEGRRWSRSLFETDDLETAIKWLKGEEAK